MYNIHAGSTTSINIFPSTLFQLSIQGLKFPMNKARINFFIERLKVFLEIKPLFKMSIVGAFSINNYYVNERN